MDLDIESVKALSSRTRLRMLGEMKEGNSTTTNISDTMDLSKSTVSGHLDTLEDAGLVEKDQKEGRRRVTYRLTSKAEAIVEGRKRKVRFSLVSSLAMVSGGLYTLTESLPGESSNRVSIQTAEASAPSGNPVMTVLAVVLVITALGLAAYGLGLREARAR